MILIGSTTLGIGSSISYKCHFSNSLRRGFYSKAHSKHLCVNGGEDGKKKRVVVVGSGWAGLAAANHLCNQGFDTTVLEPSNNFGGADIHGIRGYWRPYKNIFGLVDELGIAPFTNWTAPAHYSVDGLEVKFPLFQDLPQLPTPLGTLIYPEFPQLPLLDRLTSLLLMAAVIDFDNTDTAWRKYDSITARELFRQFSCSGKLYSSILNPLLQVGLYAPAEQCSAAATLGILYYTILAHQNDFNLVWCRGTVKERIFQPWMDLLESKGCKFVGRRKLTDVIVDDDTNCLSDILCGRERYEADAVVFAVEISVLQELIRNSAALYTKEEFVKVLNLRSVDLLTVKLWFDRKVNIPTASNSCSALDNSFGWSFFNLNAIQDEYKDESVTVLQADFYHANELLPLNDEVIVEKVKSYLSTCIKDFENAIVVKKEIGKFPESLTHFFPGSYKYMMRGFTSFPNVFMAGDWIINRHGSWSQEKSYVTGLEAANRVVDFLEEGSFAKIVPVDEEEPHVEALRGLNRRIDEIRSQLPFNGFFL
ncbi:phytoene dehydrogenase-like isoform X1 [Cucumis melo var. makuwa]|uniref:Phytoene dehydrogenase-like isoform X1 n=1 Tax=Cucumis melo var. makuwa TaxID=1194695 RepID=A0A5A7TRS4_CUCMM|nr:phytoene dehydrogenase-like isoform X1 [Cucumis melo var. makuwa]